MTSRCSAFARRFPIFAISVLLVSLAGSPLRLSAQCVDSTGREIAVWDFDETEGDSPGVLRVVGDFFTPQLVKDIRRIRQYVRHPRFREFQHLCGDLRAVDAIYQKALKIVEYDIGRALFVSFMATIEHQQIDVRVPVVGAVGLPLTFEEDSLFRMRFDNLPCRIYRDTPPGDFGDRDKLQHFFGSAYLAYAAESPELARATGNFVESGEAAFVVGGVDDPRDRRANLQGETFGHDLLYVQILLPSDYLQLPVD